MTSELGFWGCISAVAVWSISLGALIGGWWDMRAERRRLEVRTREAEGFMAESRADMARLRALTTEGRRNAAELDDPRDRGAAAADRALRGPGTRSGEADLDRIALSVAMRWLCAYVYREGLEAVEPEERVVLMKWPAFDMDRVPVLPKRPVAGPPRAPHEGWSQGGDEGNILGVFKLSQGWEANLVCFEPLTFEFRKAQPATPHPMERVAGVPMNDY